jgi:SAM-dependent MidA family methyltransferase
MTASTPPSILPPLSPDEARHSQAVERLIRERIAAAGGWLSFEAFMELALYAPGLGYYSAGGAKIGAAGDFITAPELSDLFSRCVAQQCAEILATPGGEILELGAGTGRMAAAILESLASLDVLPRRYAILEVSADLRDRQRASIERLPASLRDRVTWLDRLPERPMTGIVLANEVLDALPCHRFVIREGRAHVLGVAIDADGRLVEREAAAFAELLNALPAPLPEGYASEFCPRVPPWIASLAESLDRGVMLLFDYGLPRAQYYHPQRSEGTLRCHFKQRAHDDPFINIGLQDITAWVDFTLVAESAIAANLDVLGFATQAAFLLGTGIDSETPTMSSSEQARWASQARQLLLPGEMGEAFKVMALGRDYEAPLRGFALQDLRRSL